MFWKSLNAKIINISTDVVKENFEMLHPQKCSKKLFSGIDVYVVKMLYETSNGNVKVKNLVIETQRYRTQYYFNFKLHFTWFTSKFLLGSYFIYIISVLFDLQIRFLRKFLRAYSFAKLWKRMERCKSCFVVLMSPFKDSANSFIKCWKWLENALK